MKQVDWEESKNISQLIDAREYCCVTNIARAFLRFKNDIPHDAVYTEGFRMDGGQRGKHTWIETANSIIDPTLVCETRNQSKKNTTHHPVKELSESEIRSRFQNQSIEPGVEVFMDEYCKGWDKSKVRKLKNKVDPRGSW